MFRENKADVYTIKEGVLEIYLYHKFQWPQEGLNCKSLVYEVMT